MFKGLVVCLVLALACGTQVLIEAESNDNQGVIECIVKKFQNITNPLQFCGPKIKANSECHTAYAALRLCLLNNGCQDDEEDQ